MTGAKIAAVVVGVLALTSSSAMADAVVCVNCFDEPTAVVQNVVTAANWVTQLERMTRQVQEQILIFQQLSGVTNVNGMATILNQAANFNQMNSFGNVVGMLQGGGGGIGGRGSKAGYTRRRVDAPRLDDGTVIFS
jgi:conjugal transfer/entry exclusion protein